MLDSIQRLGVVVGLFELAVPYLIWSGPVDWILALHNTSEKEARADFPNQTTDWLGVCCVVKYLKVGRCEVRRLVLGLLVELRLSCR